MRVARFDAFEHQPFLGLIAVRQLRFPGSVYYGHGCMVCRVVKGWQFLGSLTPPAAWRALSSTPSGRQCPASWRRRAHETTCHAPAESACLAQPVVVLRSVSPPTPTPDALDFRPQWRGRGTFWGTPAVRTRTYPTAYPQNRGTIRSVECCPVMKCQRGSPVNSGLPRLQEPSEDFP